MRHFSAGLLAVACLAVPAALQAAQPQFWQLEGARDFLDGETEGLSVDSEGRVRLAPATRVLQDPEAPYVWSLARDTEGRLYVGTGNNYAAPSSPHEDSLISVDIESGALRWAQQFTKDLCVVSHQGGNADHHRHENVEQYEGRAAELPNHVRESPDVAEQVLRARNNYRLWHLEGYGHSPVLPRSVKSCAFRDRRAKTVCT